MLDILLIFAAGLGLLFAIFIVAGCFVFFMKHVLTPTFDWIGKNYPRFSSWFQGVFAVTIALFIIYYFGMIVMGKM